MERIEWTREADHWLTEIFTFISHDSPAAAGRVVEEIYQLSGGTLRYQMIDDSPQHQ